jgi:2'-5' RNA ligase
VASIAACVAVPFQPFKLVLDQPKLWPHGLAVLCATEVPKPLQELHERLGHALRGRNLRVDTRPYQAHITLARHAEGATPPIASVPVVWWLQGFALVVSTSDKDPRYRVVHQYR